MIIIGLTAYFVVVSVFVAALAYAAARPTPQFENVTAMPVPMTDHDAEEITEAFKKAA